MGRGIKHQRKNRPMVTLPFVKRLGVTEGNVEPKGDNTQENAKQSYNLPVLYAFHSTIKEKDFFFF